MFFFLKLCMIFFINDHLEAKNVNSAFNENVNDIKIVRMDSPCGFAPIFRYPWRYECSIDTIWPPKWPLGGQNGQLWPRESNFLKKRLKMGYPCSKKSMRPRKKNFTSWNNWNIELSNDTLILLRFISLIFNTGLARLQIFLQESRMKIFLIFHSMQKLQIERCIK